MMVHASTCAREGATTAIQGVGAEGLGRRGERSFDGKAAAHASEPRCVRTARAGSAHLHVSQHATSSLSKESHGSEPAGSKGGERAAVAAGAAAVAAGAAETAALAGETVAMTAVVAEAAVAADAAVPQAVQVAVARAAAVVPAAVMAAAGWQRR